MKYNTFCACAGLASLAGTAFARPQVTTKGNAFFANGQRFYVRGIDYQPGGSSAGEDPIADPAVCQRDIVNFKKLGINTVRVYAVDNSKNHDACMAALAAAGIYLALDVNNSLYSINRDDPSPSYNAKYLQSVFATIDAFAKYDNTLLFYSGNEVINSPQNSNCAPYVKAVGRDMKNYIKARKYRQIPVGYSAADVQENRYQAAVYMNCGDDAQARSDFFAFNDYSYCDPSTYAQSDWPSKVATYGNYSIPLFLSELGCNQNPPRDFSEVTALFSGNMTPVYSGGLVYEYSYEADNPNFGIVDLDGSSATPRQPEFNNLMNALKGAVPQGDGGYKPNLPFFAECPAQGPLWNFDTNAPLPAMPADAQQYFRNGAGLGPGFTGTGSQNGGNATTPPPVTSSPTSLPSSTSASASRSTSTSASVSASTSTSPSPTATDNGNAAPAARWDLPRGSVIALVLGTLASLAGGMLL